MGSIQLQTGKGKLLGLSSAVVDTVEIDETLTISGTAADAKATGDALAEKADKTELVGKAGTGEGAEIFNNYEINVASGDYAHAEGSGSQATGACSHAEGSQTIASAPYSHAEGNQSKASGESSHAEGEDTVANGVRSHAEGHDSVAYGDSSHAEGIGTIAGDIKNTQVKGAHAEGANTRATDSYAHAEGNSTKATGYASHAEGHFSIASGAHSHAEGLSTQATSECAHAEGNATVASRQSSHAEGQQSKAVGNYSHAEGAYTTASGTCSHAGGYGTTAASESQHVQGKYNIEDSDGVYAHIVGNGTSDTNRSNAHTLDWDGNAWFAGKVTVGADAEELATKSDLDAKADKQNKHGGFAAGDRSESTEGGGAIGYDTYAFAGGAVGTHAKVTNAGGAVGADSEAGNGGAVGEGAKTSSGFAGGAGAQAVNADGAGIDAIQLGTGTNSVPKTLQVYSHTVMNADGSLPYVHTARPYVEETLSEVLALNTIYDLGTQTSVTLKLPSANVGNFIQVDFLCGNTPATFTIDAASSAIVSDYDFTPEPDKAYSLFFDYGRLAGSLYGWRFSYAEYTYTEV